MNCDGNQTQMKIVSYNTIKIIQLLDTVAVKVEHKLTKTVQPPNLSNKTTLRNKEPLKSLSGNNKKIVSYNTITQPPLAYLP